MITPEELSNKIKEVRSYLGLTQTEFGNLICASKQGVCAWEKGRALPDVISLLRIAELAPGGPIKFFTPTDEILLQDNPTITSTEAKIIAKIRTLPLSKRNAIETLLEVNHN